MKKKISSGALAFVMALFAIAVLPGITGGKAGIAANVSAVNEFADSGLLPSVRLPSGIVSKSRTNKIDLRWKAVSGAEAYRVYILDPSDGKYKKYKDVTEAKCTVEGLKKGTKYKFRIAALNSSMNEFTLSKIFNASTAKLPALPKGFISKCGTDSITLSWKAVSGAKAYRVYMLDPFDGKFKKYKTVKSEKCVVTGLEKGKSYKFRIAALDGKKNEKTLSDPVSVSTAALPLLPEGFLSSAEGDKLTVSWKAVSGADAYRIYMFSSETGKYEKYRIVTKEKFVINGYKKGNKYLIKVAALEINDGKYKEITLSEAISL